jgi:hypothetical protein
VAVRAGVEIMTNSEAVSASPDRELTLVGARTFIRGKDAGSSWAMTRQASPVESLPVQRRSAI